MSRNSKKGNAEMSRPQNEKKSGNPNKVNKYGKLKTNRMSKENQFLSESDSFKSVINNNENENTCEDLIDEDEDEIGEENLEGATASSFPFDLAMWDVSTN